MVGVQHRRNGLDLVREDGADRGDKALDEDFDDAAYDVHDSGFLSIRWHQVVTVGPGLIERKNRDAVNGRNGRSLFSENPPLRPWPSNHELPPDTYGLAARPYFYE